MGLLYDLNIIHVSAIQIPIQIIDPLAIQHMTMI